MTLYCTDARNQPVGDAFDGDIAPTRPRDAQDLKGRTHPPHTHTLLCAATAPVAPNLRVVTPNGRAYSVSKPYDAQVGSEHERHWLLVDTGEVVA